MIYVVGIGPGGPEQMTPQAKEALNVCDVIMGYKKYIELIRPHFPGKKFEISAMKEERDRCGEALKKSLDGETVALVSSGDPGVYGMAGVMIEVADGRTEVIIVPGITAANSAAALLGAPLMHDFAVISLSDLLTPWEMIEKRIAAAAATDFVICLYNPASSARTEQFPRACEIISAYRSPNTPAAWVRNAGRRGEEKHITMLKEIKDEKLDMFCTVIIGNSTTKIVDGQMVTPRGYEI